MRECIEMKRFYQCVMVFAPLIMICFSVFGCGHVWTREFIIENQRQSFNSDGWTIEPDVFAFSNVGGTGAEPTSQRFTINISIAHPKDPKRDRPDTTTYFTIDTLTIAFLAQNEKQYLPMAGRVWLSYAYDQKYVKCMFCFAGCGEYKADSPPPLTIPQGVDSILLSFNMKLKEGILYAVSDHPSFDSIAPVSPGNLLSIIPIRIKMIRHETEHRIPSFLIQE